MYFSETLKGLHLGNKKETIRKRFYYKIEPSYIIGGIIFILLRHIAFFNSVFCKSSEVSNIKLSNQVLSVAFNSVLT